MKRNSQQGVALVITLILLSVITFMAVTFLVVTRREREQTTTQLNQTDARLAADAAVEQAKATIIASMLARPNGQDFGLVVSTNFISSAGFDPIQSTPNLTNVNYDHLLNGNPLGVGDRIANIANLQILPRPPVYVTTNKNPAFPPDFRFYLDLNRNGAYDTNGYGQNYDLVGGNFTFLKNPDGSPSMNFFVGDPEWIGVLDKPYYPHSSSNFFTARFAYFAVPIGNDLDLNYIHNEAKRLPKNKEGFLRNEGVGSWEINLAAFLFYLNTNFWGNAPSITPYQYSTNMAVSSAGNAFQAAFGLLTYRYDNGINRSWGTLNSVHNDFAGFADLPFASDFIDGYVNGPLWTNTAWPQIDLDTSLVTLPWSGSDNPSHFFTTQDLFNAEANNSIMMGFFTNQLYTAGTNLVSSYDRYTFYRLWEQMGVESAPETSGKVNLNYDTVHSKPNNFVRWTPVSFFTNAADAMLHNLATNISGGAYPTDLGVANIPIYPTNFYTPSVHRLLQVAANIYDASTNRMFEITTSTNWPPYPSVFRPTFGMTTTNGVTNIFINGYVEVGPTDSDPVTVPISISTAFHT